jgi:hypothetical protein
MQMLLTGDHASYIAKKYFEKLGLKNTFYRNDPGYLHYKLLVDSYWDSIETPANPQTSVPCSKQMLLLYLVMMESYAPPVDAVKIFKRI